MAFIQTSSVRLNFMKDLHGGTHLRPSREFKGLGSNPNCFENGYANHLLIESCRRNLGHDSSNMVKWED